MLVKRHRKNITRTRKEFGVSRGFFDIFLNISVDCKVYKTHCNRNLIFLHFSKQKWQPKNTGHQRLLRWRGGGFYFVIKVRWHFEEDWKNSCASKTKGRPEFSLKNMVSGISALAPQDKWLLRDARLWVSARWKSVFWSDEVQRFAFAQLFSWNSSWHWRI